MEIDLSFGSRMVTSYLQIIFMFGSVKTASDHPGVGMN